MATTCTGDIVVLSSEEYEELIKKAAKLTELEKRIYAFGEFQPLADLEFLQPGMTGRNKMDKAHAYLVQANYGKSAIVSRTQSIYNAAEWEVLA